MLKDLFIKGLCAIFLLIGSFDVYSQGRYLVVDDTLYFYAVGKGLKSKPNKLSRKAHFFALDLKTGEKYRLLDDATESKIGRIEYLSVSPDRKFLCLVCDVSPKDDSTRLVLFNRVTREVKILVDNGKDNEFPVFSPDGTHIAFYASDPMCVEKQVEWLGKEKRGGALMVVEVATSKTLELAPPDYILFKFSSPSWSPDGKQIVFFSAFESLGDKHLYRVDINGENLTRITSEPLSTSFPSPVWMADNRIYFCEGRTKISPGGIFAIDPDGKSKGKLFYEDVFSEPMLPSPDRTKLLCIKTTEEGTFFPLILNLKGEDVTEEYISEIFGRTSQSNKETGKLCPLIFKREGENVTAEDIGPCFTWRY